MIKTTNVRILVTIRNRIYTTDIFLPYGYKKFTDLLSAEGGSYRLWRFCNLIYNIMDDEILKNRYSKHDVYSAMPFLEKNAEFVELETLINLVNEEIYP